MLPELPSPRPQGHELPPFSGDLRSLATPVMSANVAYPGDEGSVIDSGAALPPPPYAGADQDRPAPREQTIEVSGYSVTGEAVAAPNADAPEAPAALPIYSEQTVAQARETLAPWLAKYGAANLVDSKRLVDTAITDDPADSVLPSLFGKAVLERIREERRAAPKVLPRPSAEHKEQMPFRNIEAKFTQWGEELRTTNEAAADLKIDDMVRRMTRFVDRFASRNAIDALPLDDAVLRAVWDAYSADVLALKTQAGLKRPEINAEYQESGPIIEEIQKSDQPGRARDMADRKPTDPVGAIRGNSKLIEELSETYVMDGTVSAALVRQVVHSRREQARETLETYVQQLGTAADEHHNDTGAEEMFEFLRTHHVADPEQWIQRCLGRQEVLATVFAEDPDFANSHVLGNLSSKMTSDDPQAVIEEGRAYKVTLARLRGELARNPGGVEVSDDVVRIIAASVRVTSLPAVHRRYAIAMQQKINAGELAL
jgi:hypothetical protein